MRCNNVISACVVFACIASTADAANLRGNSRSCPPPPGIYQGSVSYSSLTPGSRATYSCRRGCDMSGSSTINCSSMGTWSGGPPECRVHYDKKNDGTYKNHDKGYTLYTG